MGDPYSFVIALLINIAVLIFIGLVAGVIIIALMSEFDYITLRWKYFFDYVANVGFRFWPITASQRESERNLDLVDDLSLALLIAIDDIIDFAENKFFP